MIELKSNVPDGPLDKKWDKHRFDMKLVNPANKRKYSVIVVGSGLAGGAGAASLAELGYNVTKVAHRLRSALNEISKENFDGALVNIGIDDQKHGNDIADILLAKNIPFAFVTGYGHALEQRHAGIPLLQKPFNREQLRVLLEAIVGPGGSPNHSTSHAA